MEDVLWGMTWINATMYTSTIPVNEINETVNNEDGEHLDREYISPEDELKFIKPGKID